MEKEYKETEKKDFTGYRAFLQRGEVRLSTMHRVASAFLGGAGLLFLFPLFTRDFFKEIVFFIINNWQIGFNPPEHNYIILAIIIIIILSLFIPILSLYLLLKDLTRFYFTSDPPGFDNSEYLPRLSLSSIAYPNDEEYPDEGNREDINKLVCDTELINFILPKKHNQIFHLDKIYNLYKKHILPKELKIDNEEFTKNEAHKNFRAFMVTLGITSHASRSINKEIAKMEVSLSRHSFILRSIVLRYVKALVLFILTAIVYSFISALISNTNQNQINHIINYNFNITWIAFIFSIYSALVPFVVKLPIRWIKNSTDSHNSLKEIVRIDKDLILFERIVSIVSSIILFISVWTFIDRVFELSDMVCMVISSFITLITLYLNIGDNIQELQTLHRKT